MCPSNMIHQQKIKIIPETELAKITMLEIEKDKGGTKETMQAVRIYG